MISPQCISVHVCNSLRILQKKKTLLVEVASSLVDMLIKADKCMSMRNEGCLIIGLANNYDTKDSNWYSIWQIMWWMTLGGKVFGRFKANAFNHMHLIFFD